MRTVLSSWLTIGFILNQALFAQALIPFRQGKQWGFSNRDKEMVIAGQFEDARFFMYDVAKVKQNGHWGLVDKDGRIFLPCRYNIIYAAARSGRVVVCIGGDKDGHGGKWGYQEKYEGQEFSLLYDLIRECDAPGLLGVSLNGKWGCIRDNGSEAIPIRYDVQLPEDHVLSESSYSTLSIENVPALSTGAGSAYLKIRFRQGLARVGLNGQWGFINAYGNPVIPLEYDFVGEFAEDVVCTVKSTPEGRKIGFLDRNNQVVIPFIYDFAPDAYRTMRFQEGLAGSVREAGGATWMSKIRC
ncbi:MAG: WG repeat-containing protein [Bacteroidia bacterium]|nr:WG repeat-containing protein [Bacteroidia bacterium]